MVYCSNEVGTADSCVFTAAGLLDFHIYIVFLCSVNRNLCGVPPRRGLLVSLPLCLANHMREPWPDTLEDDGPSPWTPSKRCGRNVLGTSNRWVHSYCAFYRMLACLSRQCNMLRSRPTRQVLVDRDVFPVLGWNCLAWTEGGWGIGRKHPIDIVSHLLAP